MGPFNSHWIILVKPRVSTAPTPSTREDLGKERIPLPTLLGDAVHSSLLWEALIHPLWMAEIRNRSKHNSQQMCPLLQPHLLISSGTAAGWRAHQALTAQSPGRTHNPIPPLWQWATAIAMKRNLFNSGLYNIPAIPSLATLHGHYSWRFSKEAHGALSGGAGPDWVAIYCPFDCMFLLCEAEVGLRGEGLEGWRASTHLRTPQRSILQPPTQKSSNGCIDSAKSDAWQHLGQTVQDRFTFKKETLYNRNSCTATQGAELMDLGKLTIPVN